MFQTLFAKLTIRLLFVFMLIAVLTLSLTFVVTDLYQQEVMQKLNDQVAAHIVQETDIFEGGHVDYPKLRKLFHSLMVLNPNLEIYLLNHKGSILAFSAPPWKVVRLSVDLAPIRQYFSEQSNLPIRGDDPRDFSKKKVFSAARVALKNSPGGYMYVILGGEEYDSIVERIKGSYILGSSFIVLASGLFISFIVGALLFSRLTKRLKQLAVAVSEFEQYPQTVPLFPECDKKGDEIDRLTFAFQNMANRIHQQLDDLQTTDHLRRELIANVSHDLRTPLATLQGYIETLQIKEDDLDEQERRYYLHVAIKHCTRLNQLVTELFELARLDARETQLNPEVFNLVELTEDVVQKFSLSTGKKNIHLQVDYVSTELFVYADICLIERVLENLLGNSLRFVTAGGMIRIALHQRGQHIHVKVIDNGSGIPEAELPFIFDRFYHLDKNRHVESKHCGLGLAIVKKIIDLHESMIEVSSIPGQKTEFSFVLPVCTH